jgi:hypothetical protein
MSNTYSGAGGAGTLEVRTVNLATDLFGIDIIEVSNGTLTVGSSPNIAVINTGGGGGGGVTTIAFGTTGLTPAAATAGGVTVAGTLVAANGGTSFSTYAQGDIIYASAANTLAKLTKGAAGQVLTMNGGATIPEWAAPTGGIGGTIAAGQVAFGTAADTIGGDADFTFDNLTGLIVQGTQATIESIDTTNDYIVSIFGGGGPQINFGQLPNKSAYMEISAAGGRNIIDTKLRDFEISGTNNNLMYLDEGDGFVGIGDIYSTTNLPTNTLIVGKEDAGTNTILYPLTISRNSTGTAAVGLGVGLEFESEGPAQAGVNYVGSIMESVSVAGTNAGNTRYDIVLKNYNGAAASEVARFTSTGGFTTTSSVAAGTTIGLDPDAGGTVTVGGTGGVSTTDGPINAGGATGAVTANTTVSAGSTVTAATGVIATTGGVLASAGGVTATLGNIVATAGNITTTAGSISSATTVTGGTGVVATINDVTAAAGNVVAGVNLRATLGLEVGTNTQYTGFATLVDSAPLDTDTSKFFQIGTGFTNVLIPASGPGVEITVFCDVGPATLIADLGATIQGGAFTQILFEAGVPGAATLYCTGAGADWFVVGSVGAVAYA